LRCVACFGIAFRLALGCIVLFGFFAAIWRVSEHETIAYAACRESEQDNGP